MRTTTPLCLARTAITCVAALGAGALAGCGDDEPASKPAAPAASAAPAAPASFAIEATADGKTKKKLTFPDSVKAGLVTLTLKNSDSVPRSAGIVRLLDDHTVEEFEKAVDKEGAPIPAWIEDGGGLTAVKPGQTGSVTQVLAPGKYGITDDETESGDGEGKSNSDLGARGEFTVTGPPSEAKLPDQPATLTATDDGQDEYGFEFDGLKAGVNQVRFENTGKELHHAIIFPINKGKTIADVTAAFASDKPPKGPPPVDFENGLGTQVIDGGIAQNLELEFKAGKYAVVCFIQDRKGGKPHVAQGMIDELTIE
ncbi:MAG: hypothetical protein AVDCRST_MAG53-2030 [uncultured Solirubrobacteraceae bacterium]|uniref:Uncharacterized protein n=2 Tax=uncultured Solirubrobacteraceae bacterium TaxID=1162706 RepID=A0A6J4SQ54_9ACTN|nr:MAG: hypothetical protein AVDCRST_MAG53-2030 [uncultured Solirubrobacteraceae bacterium]